MIEHIQVSWRAPFEVSASSGPSSLLNEVVPGVVCPSTQGSERRIRQATIADSATIARQRCAMFQDNGLSGSASFDDLEQRSAVWLQRHIADSSYVGWLAEHCGNIIGGAGVWFMEWPPHYLDVMPERAYLLNFYVLPEARGQGLAGQLLHLATEECRRRGVRVAVLHASAMGRPIYESKGWRAGNEMMLRLDEMP